MANEFAGLTIKFEGDSRGLTSTLRKIRREGNDATRELKQIERALEVNPSSAALATRQIELMGRRAKSTERELAALRAVESQIGKEKMSSGAWTRLQSDIAIAEQRLQGYNREIMEAQVRTAAAQSTLGRLGAALDERSGAIQRIGSGISGIGSALTRTLTPAVAAAGAASVAAAVDIDTGLTNVRKTVDGTEEQYQALKRAAVEFSETNAVGAREILDIQALGAQLGFTVDELDKFSQVVSGLDIATNMDAEQAGTELAQFANITKMGHDEVERYGSAIVGLGNSMATTESDISSMAMRLASAGKQVGMSQADILGIAAALASLGVEAEAGGTAVSTIMATVDKTVSKATDGVRGYAEQAGMSVSEMLEKIAENPEQFEAIAEANGQTLKAWTKEVVDSLDDLDVWAETAGMSAERFAAAWKESPVEAFAALLSNMESATSEGSNMSIMLEDLGIESLRQTDVMKRLAGNSGLVADAVAKANDEWESNTALQKEVDNRNESLAAKFEILKNRAIAAAEQVGGPLADALLAVVDDAEPLIQAISDGARAFAEMDEDEQRAVLQAVALSAALGPLLSVGGRLVGSMSGAGSAIKELSADMAKAGGAGQYMLGGVSGLARAGLWGILIAGAAGTAKGIADLVDHMADMETIAAGSSGALKTLFATDASALSQTAEEAGRSIDDLGKSVREVTDDAARLLSDMAEDFADVSVDNSRLESYAEAIGSITEKSNPTRDDLYELQGAVAAVNDALGTEYSVQEGFAGHLEVIDESGRNATQAILDLIAAQQLQRQQEAMSGYMDDVWAQKADAVKTMKAKYEELQRATENYNNCTRDQFATDREWREAMDGRESQMNAARQEYEDAKTTLDALNGTYQNLTDSTTLLAAAQQNGADSLEWAVANSQTLMTAMAEADKSTLDFASDLSQAGVSAAEFAGLSDTALLDLAAAYDGTFASIAGILAENGVRWDEDAAKVMTAADSMAKSAFKLDGGVRAAIAQMQVSTGQSFEDFCQSLADAGVAAEDFAELTPEQMAQVISSYDGTVESVSALLEQFADDNREKGEEGASAYADGIDDNAGEAASAAQGMASSAASSADAYDEFKAKGENNAEGFADGIRAKAAQAAEEAAKMVIGAIASAAGAQKSASPSKVTKKLGNYFDDGFSLGISDSADEPAREAAAMVDGAITALGAVDGTWIHGYHAAVNYAEGVAAGAFRADEAADEGVDALIAGYRSRAGQVREASREIGDAIWGGISQAVASLGRQKADTQGVYAAFDAIRKAGYDLDSYTQAVADYNRESDEWTAKLAESRKEIREGYAEWRAEEDYKAKIAALDEKIAKAEAKASKSKKSSGSKELARLKAQKEAIRDKYEVQRDAAKYAKEAAEWQDKLKNGDASLNEQYAAWIEDNAELKKLMATVQKNATMDDLAEWWNVAEMKAAVNDATEAADGYSETLDALFKKSNTFSDAGVVFTKGFVEKFISGSEDYKDALAKLGKMTTEQIQHMVDCYEDSARAERELEMNQRSLWVNGLKATTSGAKNVKDLMLDFRDTCLDIKEAVYGDAGLTAAFEKAGVSFEGFAMDLQSVNYTMEDFKSKYDSMVQTVSNGFQRMSRENQVSAADWKYNLQANMAESQAFADNLAKVMAKIPESIDSDAFRKAVLEGGYSQFGQMMMDMANMSAQQIGEMVQLYNESIVEGQQSAIEQFQAIAPGEEMMLAAIEGINSLNADLAAAAGGAAHGAAEEMASYSMEFNSIGALLIDGASAGVMAQASTLASSAAAVVRSAIEAAKAEADIHSPSRVMRREIGQMMGRGVALGMEDEKRTASESAMAVVSATVDAGARAWGKLQGAQAQAGVGDVTNNYSTSSASPTVIVQMDVDARGNDYEKLQRELNKVVNKAMKASGLA